MTLSKTQKKALEMIDKIELEFGSRWFIQEELPGINMHTINALVNKKHLITKESNGIEYYKLQIVQEMKKNESD